jgi:putative ABC transport system substrate-binding protein
MSSSQKSSGYLFEELRTGLKALGYVEGQTIILDARWAENKLERLPALVGELLSGKVDVLVTSGSPGVMACRKATSTVPIVFVSLGDPINQGFIESYRHPGGNLTGVSWNEEINKKQYEIVKAILPKATRIATLVNVNNPAQKHHLEDLPVMSKALHFKHIIAHATNEEELEFAFLEAKKAKANAVVETGIAPFASLHMRIIELQNKYRLPTFHSNSKGVKDGGLASYSFPMEENFRRGATFVDKILKGTKPGEIPVEIPMKYEIAINLKTAKALGIRIPDTFLARVNLVIE